jgi:LuxR family maltose regulon positive regulatory protein
MYQARLWLAQGNIAAAGDWMSAAQSQSLPASIFYPPNIQRVTQARLLIAQRKTEAALSLLRKLLGEPRNLLTVEAFALLALARQTHGDSVHAILALEQALTLAEAENRLHVFLDLGQPMGKLLATFCEAHPNHIFAHRLLTEMSMSPKLSSPVESLSEREVEILRLIVTGHSNDEIAQALTLAVSTVKWYINTLYSKLHVKTRGQAIARAHELKLIGN